jgi:hypothetical protein
MVRRRKRSKCIVKLGMEGCAGREARVTRILVDRSRRSAIGMTMKCMSYAILKSIAVWHVEFAAHTHYGSSQRRLSLDCMEGGRC